MLVIKVRFLVSLLPIVNVDLVYSLVQGIRRIPGAGKVLALDDIKPSTKIYISQ